MDSMKLQRYNLLHDEVIKRLQNGEITIETAKDVNELLFNKYIVESDDSDDSTDDRFKDMMKRVVKLTQEFFKKYREWMHDAVKKLNGQVSEAYMKKFKEILDMLDKLDDKEKNTKVFKFFDVDAAWQCYEKECSEYLKILHLFNSNMIYEKSDDDIKAITNKVADIHKTCSEKMTEIIEKKKEYKIKDLKIVYNALDNICSNRTWRYSDIFNEYENISEKIERRITDYEDDSIQKIRYIQQIMTKISDHTYQDTSKFISAILSDTKIILGGNPEKDD